MKLECKACHKVFDVTEIRVGILRTKAYFCCPAGCGAFSIRLSKIPGFKIITGTKIEKIRG